MRDIVILAGSSPWSVLSLCKTAQKYHVRSFVVCVNNGWGRKYQKSSLIDNSYDVNENDLPLFWDSFFSEIPFNTNPILYVTSDYSCQIVERNRQFYEQRFMLCMASSYIINSFIDKSIAVVESAKHGLTVPKTIDIKDKKDLEYVEKCFHFPIIVKPTTYQGQKDIGFKMRVFPSIVSFLAFCKTIDIRRLSFQCQEYIPGEDKDYFFYEFYRNQQGTIVECMGEKTLQTNGIMTIGTTKNDRRLQMMSRSFLESIDYVGIGGIEFKRFKDEFYFIEMSTRTEGFLAVSDMAGVSLAEASFLDLNGYPISIVNQKDNVKYMVLKPWLKHIKALLRHWRIPSSHIKLFFSRSSHFVDFFMDFKFGLFYNTNKL